MRQLLKTRLFAEYKCIQRIRGITHYALYKFTYLFTYLLTLHALGDASCFVLQYYSLKYFSKIYHCI